jgi:antitoxin ParD1/3/4
MEALHVTITPEQQSYLHRRLETGEYATASEYVRSLIREDQRRVAQDQLEARLLASLDTEAIELDDAALDMLHRVMTEKIDARRRSRDKA